MSEDRLKELQAEAGVAQPDIRNASRGLHYSTFGQSASQQRRHLVNDPRRQCRAGVRPMSEHGDEHGHPFQNVLRGLPCHRRYGP